MATTTAEPTRVPLAIEAFAALSASERDRRWAEATPSQKVQIRRILRLEDGAAEDLAWYKPRGGAAALQEADEPEVLIVGPAGTGKSMAALFRMFDLAVHYPGMRGLIVRKTAKSLTASALATWEQKIVEGSLRSGYVTFFGGSAREPAQYRFANGSRVLIGGMDNPDKVMSTEFDLIFVQEAIELSENDWEALTTRLRNGRLPRMQIIADTNPSAPSHWLRRRAAAGTLRMIESRHEDNPTLFGDDGELTPGGVDYIRRLDNLTGVRLHRLRHGRWVAAEGVVYEEWDPSVHLVDIDPAAIPLDWPRIWAVDFGFTNPFVCQWWAIDPDGRAILYREWVRTNMLVADHARRIMGFVTDANGRWVEPKPRAVVCDHDAEGRAQLLEHTGLATTPARKEVATGIEAVQARLRVAGDGLPRLLVGRGALVDRDPRLDEAKRPIGLAEEIEAYAWEPAREGRPAKEVPVAVDDHSCDAARYLVRHVDLPSAGRVRFIN